MPKLGYLHQQFPFIIHTYTSHAAQTLHMQPHSTYALPIKHVCHPRVQDHSYRDASFIKRLGHLRRQGMEDATVYCS